MSLLLKLRGLIYGVIKGDKTALSWPGFIQYILNTSKITKLRNITKLIKRIYGEQPKKKKGD